VVNRRLLAWLISGALVVAVVGGWLLSRASDDGNDANSYKLQQDLGDPTIGTNKPVTGKYFPFTKLTRVSDGNTAQVLEPGKPTVVNFWYSTCTPCRREMPIFGQSAIDYLGRIAFIGVNPNDDAETASGFMKDANANFETFLDTKGELLTTLGIGTMPTTLFIDATGKIVALHAGEITHQQLIDLIYTKLGADY
jgi:thiol-disulfide isomerase/thioredoxin